MTIERTPIIVAAALAMLCTVGCKKQETTSPDDATPTDVDEAEPDESSDLENDPEAAVLSKAGFDETVHENMSDVTDCYVTALGDNPDLAGTMDVEFTIGEDGTPTAVVVVEGSELSDEALATCISGAAMGWHFDPPPEPEMKLRFPFKLAPAPE